MLIERGRDYDEKLFNLGRKRMKDSTRKGRTMRKL
jgi:hypothetical protein